MLPSVYAAFTIHLNKKQKLFKSEYTAFAAFNLTSRRSRDYVLQIFSMLGHIGRLDREGEEERRKEKREKSKEQR